MVGSLRGIPKMGRTLTLACAKRARRYASDRTPVPGTWLEAKGGVQKEAAIAGNTRGLLGQDLGVGEDLYLIGDAVADTADETPVCVVSRARVGIQPIDTAH